MKNKKTTGIIIIILMLMSIALFAAKKSIYVEPFNSKGLSRREGRRIGRVMEKALLNHEGFHSNYDMVTRDAIGASFSQEELKQSIGCTGDRCLKLLLAKSKVDLLVYGTVRSNSNYYYITAKMLDKSREEVELTRIKTIRLKDKKFINEGCSTLAGYILSGDPEDVQDFQDDMVKREKRAEKNKRSDALDKREDDSDREYKSKVQRYKEKRKNDITSHNTFYRFGYSFLGANGNDEEFNNSFSNGKLYMIEMDIPFFGSGFDYFMRYTYRTFAYDGGNPSTDPVVTSDSDISIHTFDMGMRYGIDIYLVMTNFKFFVIGGGRYQSLKISYMYGGGIEISFFPLMGIFAEYNNGTSTYQGDVSSPNGEKRYRVDNHLFIFGVTFRI